MSTADHVELPITGMTCASCANRIERRPNKLDGVTASVNCATEKATVDFDAAAVAPEQLVAAVEAAGYRASLPSAEPSGSAGAPADVDETAPLRQRLLVFLALTLQAADEQRVAGDRPADLRLADPQLRCQAFTAEMSRMTMS